MSRAERHRQRALKKKRVIWMVFWLIFLSLAVAALGFWIGYKNIVRENPPKTEKPRTQAVFEDPRVLCPLSGEKVKKVKAEGQPLAIMVENSPESRPQSGLDKADVILEMLAEGPVTRFMAIYLHEDAREVGPVRSARPYFLKRIFEFDAVYVHAGGSEQAKVDIRRFEVPHLDEFEVGRKAFWRSGDRQMPHNLYTDTAKLRQVAADKGFGRNQELHPFRFLAPGEENPGGVRVPYFVIRLLGGANNIKYVYEPSTKSYLRFHGDEPHRDALTGEQLKAKNVLIQFVNTRVIDNEGRRNMEMIGEGKLIFFTQGKIYRGTWSKESLKAKTFFRDEGGREFKLNPGQTWIEVVPMRTLVDYPLPVGR